MLNKLFSVFDPFNDLFLSILFYFSFIYMILYPYYLLFNFSNKNNKHNNFLLIYFKIFLTLSLLFMNSKVIILITLIIIFIFLMKIFTYFFKC